MKPIFSVGQTVFIRELQDLRREFGRNSTIEVPSGWNSSMDCYCGKEYLVKESYRRSDGNIAYYLVGNGWSWDECVLVDTKERLVYLNDELQVKIQDIIGNIE